MPHNNNNPNKIHRYNFYSFGATDFWILFTIFENVFSICIILIETSKLHATTFLFMHLWKWLLSSFQPYPGTESSRKHYHCCSGTAARPHVKYILVSVELTHQFNTISATTNNCVDSPIQLSQQVCPTILQMGASPTAFFFPLTLFPQHDWVSFNDWPQFELPLNFLWLIVPCVIDDAIEWKLWSWETAK